MPSDYAALKEENVRRYGTDIGRIGPMLLANRYDDRSHFLFELLQNAEDAIKRRKSSEGSRSVHFTLSTDGLRFSHFGQLFTEGDVRGICGIGESTKGEDLTAIGRFGIGFKSVYAFTDSPEIHSGDESFAIDSFVWPRALPFLDTRAEETVFTFPFRSGDTTAHQEIAAGLQGLGLRTLLFLKEIEDVSWAIDDGPSGTYLRETAETLSDTARRITLIGQESSSLDVTAETWLIFSREVTRYSGEVGGHVEIAFNLENGRIQRVANSALVAFFPTIVSTNLGFLVQGPYRTTPSRDNVPRSDEWNRHLVQETSILLVDSLHQLKALDLLTVDALSTLPLNASKFAEGSMFEPLFTDVRSALTYEPLIPQFRSGHSPGQNAKLARTQELRDLLTGAQLGALFGPPEELHWVSEEITQDRTPEVRQYLIRELNVAEITPEVFVPRLDKSFLEAQGDDWVLLLYEFLSGQPALLRLGRLDDVPLVRLQDGTHVVTKVDGQLQAFLPGEMETLFPTVRQNVCAKPEVRKFLQSLGITEPDAVDDVVRNVLPKYGGEKISAKPEDYDSDIRRIVRAFASDSTAQRDKLVQALRACKFLRVVKPVDDSKWFTVPSNAYLATERLKRLFEGVPGIFLVDDSYACLRGEEIRELLEACGAIRYLRPQDDSSLSWQEQRALREQAGHAETSGYKDRITDWTLIGLEPLLDTLSQLEIEQRSKRAKLLWEELANLEDRRGKGIFVGEYSWTHYGSYRTAFDAAFVRKLNTIPWVPGADGKLEPAEFVLFETLGWSPNPFLQSKIHFKPPIIEALAKEAGIEPGLLDLLKKIGLTSEADLRARLGITDEPSGQDSQTDHQSESLTPEEAIRTLLGGVPEPTPPIEEEEPPSFVGSGGGGHGSETSGGGHGGGHRENGQSKTSGGSSSSVGRAPGQKQGKTQTDHHAFISYIATHPDEEEPDPDGLAHEERMALEEKAIQIVVAEEPELERTPNNNPGFDLVELDNDGDPIRWVEVKAMKGTLENRPVGLSQTQFVCAQRNGQEYWLYVVEHAASPEQARIVRIQNPAGKARTFTFDHGWISVADISD